MLGGLEAWGIEGFGTPKERPKRAPVPGHGLEHLRTNSIESNRIGLNRFATICSGLENEQTIKEQTNNEQQIKEQRAKQLTSQQANEQRAD